MHALALAALAVSSLAAAEPPAAPLVDGELAEYTFRGPLVNGMGVTSLADLRGRPVVIEFWGTR